MRKYISVKELIAGRENEIVLALSPSMRDTAFNGKNQPCPYCGGKDRFRVLKSGGSIVGYYCGRGSGDTTKGDVIGLISHLNADEDYKDTCKRIEEYLGIYELNKEEKERLKKQSENNKANRIKEEKRQAIILAKKQKQVALKAAAIFQAATPVKSHQYLSSKNVLSHGLRLYKNMLVVPMVNMNRVITGLQLIKEDGGKIFLKGQDNKGNFHFIGQRLAGRPIVLCEGYATGATIHELTGLPVAVCFNAGNIEFVIRAWQKRTNQNLVLFADNDMEKQLSGKGNAGSISMKMAELYGILSVQPEFEGDYSITDWNDVANKFGKEEFIRQIRKSYEKRVAND